MYTQPTDVMPCIYGYKYIYLLQISFKTVFWCCIKSSVGVIGWKVIQTVMNISLFKAVRVLKDTYSILIINLVVILHLSCSCCTKKLYFKVVHYKKMKHLVKVETYKFSNGSIYIKILKKQNKQTKKRIFFHNGLMDV